MATLKLYISKPAYRGLEANALRILRQWDKLDFADAITYPGQP